MLKTLLVIHLLFGILSSQCSNGCLQCNANNQCTLCDITNMHYLSGNQCASKASSKCRYLSNTGQCLLCTSGFYVSTDTGACVAVATALLVPNCIEYSSTQACSQCDKNFYLASNKCHQVQKLMEGCLYYKGNGDCLSCGTGHIFSADGTTCIAKPAISNCGLFGYLSCTSCASGYVLNKGQFINSLFASNASLYDLIKALNFGGDFPFMHASAYCQYQPVSTCQTQSGLNCVTCPAGFQLNNNKCIPVSLAQLYQCDTYSQSQTCTKCKVGFYLFNAVTCKAIPANAIEGCATYDSTADAPKCALCDAGKKAQTDRLKCLARTTATISQCATLKPDAEGCQLCAGTNQPNSDSMLCLAPIDKCTKYASPTATALKCETCIDTYEPSTDSTSCVLTANLPANCAKMASSVCTKCVQGYYLNTASPPVCTQLSKGVGVPNCSSHDQVQKNTCLACNDGFALFGLTKLCVAGATGTTIDNCITYSGTYTCTACASGYYKNASGACTAIPAGSLCKTFNTDGTCDTCPTHLVKKTTGCVVPLKHVFNSCASYSFGSSTTMLNAVCASCNNFELPYSFLGLSLCVFNEQIADYTVTASTSCVRYKQGGDCLECAAGKAINASNLCVDVATCTTALPMIYDSLNGRRTACVDKGSLSDCLIAATIEGHATDVKPTSMYCIKFNTGFVPLYDIKATTQLEENYAHAYAYGDSATAPTRVLYRGFQVTGESSSITGDCTLFFKKGSTVYCLRCPFGKYLSFTYTTQVVATCVENTDCGSATQWTGLPPYLNAYLSCHVCKTSGNYPFIRVITKDTSSVNYIDDLKLPTTTTESLTLSKCEAVDYSLLVANCSIYAEITNSSKSDQKNTACLACRPGFRPRNDYIVSFKGEVSSCVPIDNCNMSAQQTIVNACSQCSSLVDGQRILYHTFDSHKQDRCFRTKGPNCYVTNNQEKCLVCYPGYYSNTDGFCDSFTIPSCSDTLSSPHNFLALKAQSFDAIAAARMHYTLSTMTQLYGCNSCATNYVKIVPTDFVNICIPSSYTRSTFNLPTGYIQYCIAYEFTAANPAVLTCKQCIGGYLPKQDKSKCLRQSPFCLTMTNTVGSCGTCIDGYFPLNGLCLPKLIDHCKDYKSGSTSQQECDTCEEGFYLTSEKRCSKGNVANCSAYEATKPEKCTLCLAGYQVYDASADASYCFPINTSNNFCKALQSNLNGGDFKCSECSVSPALYKVTENSSFDTSADQLKSICLPFTTISDCSSYEPMKILVGTSLNPNPNAFLCKKCSAAFYLSANKRKCIARTILSNNCLAYSDTADACTSCGSSTYLDIGTKNCIAYPVGIAFCYLYSDTNVCSVCSAPYYQAGGVCILSGTIINGCMVYTGDNACASCFPVFFLEANVCKQASAQNCQTYTSLSACATCDPLSNFTLLMTVDSVTSCVQNYWQDCETFMPTYPPQCQTCKKGLYLNSGVCSLVSQIIEGCAQYASATTCSVCSTGLLLSADKKSCMSSYLGYPIDQYCSAQKLSSAPTCMLCLPGFYLSDDGACNACTGAAEKQKGCLYCGKADATKCLICGPGYYQNQSGVCVPSQIFGKTQITPIPTDTINIKWDGLKEALLVWMVAIGFMFRW